MRILIIAPLPPYHRGGIEKVVGEVAKRLSQNPSADVSVWSGTLGEATAVDWNAVHVKTYHTSKQVGYASLKMFQDLKRFASDFDVIHAHGSSTLIPFIAASRAAKTPLVVSPHFHPLASNKLLGAVKPFFEHTFDAYALGKASKIICVSETEAQAISERYAVANKVVTIYNGVDVEEIRKAKPYEFDGKLILYVGRLERYKNIHRVIEAVGCLPRHFSLYVIGEGPYKRHLEALIQRSRLSKRVKLLGECSDASLYRWMKTSALLVNWSEVEAFGITVLEALAAGTPALVNDKFGLRELALLFGRAVSLISPEGMSSTDLAKAINDVAGAFIGPLDLDDFRWDRVTARTLALYEKALGA